MKKTKFALILIGIALMIMVFATGITLAIWIQQEGASVYLKITVDDDNPSIKYQIYVPVDINGHRIPGEMDVREREYTLSNPSDYDNIVGYALVGWDGGISYDKMELPNNYTMTIDNIETTKPAVAVLVDSQFIDYEFPGNSTIKEIILSDNISFIAQGAFNNMLGLSL